MKLKSKPVGSTRNERMTSCFVWSSDKLNKIVLYNLNIDTRKHNLILTRTKQTNLTSGHFLQCRSAFSRIGLLGEGGLIHSEKEGMLLLLSLPSLQVKLPGAEKEAKPSLSGMFSLLYSGLVSIQMWVRGEEA